MMGPAPNHHTRLFKNQCLPLNTKLKEAQGRNYHPGQVVSSSPLSVVSPAAVAGSVSQVSSNRKHAVSSRSSSRMSSGTPSPTLSMLSGTQPPFAHPPFAFADCVSAEKPSPLWMLCTLSSGQVALSMGSVLIS